MASMYAVYHGPGGLRRIAERVHARAVLLANALRRLRYRIVHDALLRHALRRGAGAGPCPGCSMPRGHGSINLRPLPPTRLCIALDETVTLGDLADLIAVFSLNEALPFMLEDIGPRRERAIPEPLAPDQRATSRTRSSTGTTRRPRCCATSSGSRRATCRSPRR